MPLDSQQLLVNTPHLPGVYQMIDSAGNILYVGKAKDLKKRLSSYFARQVTDVKTKKLIAKVHDVTITVTHSEADAVLLECNLIKRHQPRYNILLRDDKSFPYIYISAHDYPQIDLYRGSRKKSGKLFGPYPNSTAVREAINLLQKLFKLRTCRDSYFAGRTRPCLLYQIGRCSGPCVAHISKKSYADNVKHAMMFLEGKSAALMTALEVRMQAASKAKQYEAAAMIRDQISRLRGLQGHQVISTQHKNNIDVIGVSSDTGIVTVHLLMILRGAIVGSHTYYPKVPQDQAHADIVSAFIAQHYLRDESHISSIPHEILVDYQHDDFAALQIALSQMAGRQVHIVKPSRGDKKKWLALANTNAKQALQGRLFTKATLLQRFQALKNLLLLDVTPKRMECFDISHSMGEATVASCVVFDESGPDKSAYRRFNITGLTPGDDVAAIKQVLTRRYQSMKKASKPLPDVIIIDGGKGQLNGARQVLNTLLGDSMPCVIGVSKGPGRKAGFESIHQLDKPPMHLESDDSALHLIQQIRDEAHRFAVTGHRLRRDKSRRQSKLESIPGVGVKRRQALLRYFGGIQGVARASLDELMKVPGISKPIAQRIFVIFHDEII